MNRNGHGMVCIILATEDRRTKKTVGVYQADLSEFLDKAEIVHAPTSGCLSNETPTLY